MGREIGGAFGDGEIERGGGWLDFARNWGVGGLGLLVKSGAGAPHSILVDADQGVAVVAFGADGLDGGGGYAGFGGDEFVHAADT